MVKLPFAKRKNGSLAGALVMPIFGPPNPFFAFGGILVRWSVTALLLIRSSDYL